MVNARALTQSLPQHMQYDYKAALGAQAAKRPGSIHAMLAKAKLSTAGMQVCWAGAEGKVHHAWGCAGPGATRGVLLRLDDLQQQCDTSHM